VALVTLSIVVADIDVVVANFDRIKVYRSTTGIGGPFQEITTPTTRIPLVAGITSYTFVDVTGQDSYYYTVSYFNTITLLESSQSAPQLGSGEPALDLLSVAELKERYLFGVPLADPATGALLQDSFFQHYIRSAVGYIERRLDLDLSAKVITNERHDFIRQNYWRFQYNKLLHTPVISIQRARLVLPTNQQIIDYPLDWLQLFERTGEVHVIPGAGQSSVVAVGLTSLWTIMLQHTWDFIPLTFYFDYTSGYTAGNAPPELVDLVGMAAAIGPLSVIGDILFGPGIAGHQTWLDSLKTQTRTTKDGGKGAFASRIAMYERMIEQRIQEMRRYYKGIRLVTI
jgi:hypothetical protein